MMTIKEAAARAPDERPGNRSLIRVLIQHPGVWSSSGLTRYVSPAGGFLPLQYNGSLKLILTECNRIAPCVLVAELRLVAFLSRMTLEDQVTAKRGVHLLLVGPQQSEVVVGELLCAGYAGFVPDSSELLTVSKAIRAVARGELWASRRTIARVLNRMIRQSSSSTLTARETEILRLIGKGLRNREIADRLYITRETVRWHIRSAYSKIRVSDRLSAALYAKEYLEEEAPPSPSLVPLRFPGLLNANKRSADT